MIKERVIVFTDKALKETTRKYIGCGFELVACKGDYRELKREDINDSRLVMIIKNNREV
jgi:hypothetical protein